MMGYRRRSIWYKLQVSGQQSLVVSHFFTKGADFVKIVEKCVNMLISDINFSKL